MHAIGFQVSAATIGIAGIPFLAGFLAERTTLVAIPIVMTLGALAVIALETTLRRGTKARRSESIATAA